MEDVGSARGRKSLLSRDRRLDAATILSRSMLMGRMREVLGDVHGLYAHQVQDLSYAVSHLFCNITTHPSSNG